MEPYIDKIMELARVFGVKLIVALLILVIGF